MHIHTLKKSLEIDQVNKKEWKIYTWILHGVLASCLHVNSLAAMSDWTGWVCLTEDDFDNWCIAGLHREVSVADLPSYKTVCNNTQEEIKVRSRRVIYRPWGAFRRLPHSHAAAPSCWLSYYVPRQSCRWSKVNNVPHLYGYIVYGNLFCVIMQ
jgi:hypothetical protein